MKVDARLSKSTMLEGGAVTSQFDFCMQPHGLKSGKANKSRNTNVVINGNILLHVAHPVPDESYASDYSEDKHEESIIWKGALLSNELKDCCASEKAGLENCYVSDHEQEESLMQKNDRIAWWASTWPSVTGLEEDMVDSVCSLQSDSDEQMDAGSPLWRDAGLCKPVMQKVNRLRAVTNTDVSSTASTQSSLLGKEKVRSWGWKEVHEDSINFMEFGVPQSQDNFELFSPKAKVSEQRICMPTSIQHTGSTRNCAKDDDCKVFSCISPSMTSNSMHEGFLERSQCVIDTEDLDSLVDEAKHYKESMKKGMEEIYLLRQKVEQEELVAQQAKAEATHGAKDFLCKAEDLRQQTLLKRAQYDIQAAEIYGEKSVLTMEARELRSRLLATQAEQARAMSLLDSVRCTLAERLQKASQEKDSIVEEAKSREENAKKLLVYEEDSARMLAEDLKALEIEAELCRKLRHFLIQRGNIIDSLQGEMLVLCEDIVKFKKQVDEGTPLSASRCLSWSRMSHLTQHSASITSSINANESQASNLIETLSSTSILTISSAISGPPSCMGPLHCTVQSQYFPSNKTAVEMLDVVDEKDMLHEKVEGLTIIAGSSCDDDKSQRQSPGDLNAAGNVVPEAALASPKKVVTCLQ